MGLDWQFLRSGTQVQDQRKFPAPAGPNQMGFSQDGTFWYWAVEFYFDRAEIWNVKAAIDYFRQREAKGIISVCRTKAGKTRLLAGSEATKEVFESKV